MSIENNIGVIDFEWSSLGDFVLSDGDLSDTEKRYGEGFVQECEDRIKSAFADWKLLEERGANLETFYGEINNEATRKRLERAISFSMVKDGFLNDGDVLATAAPLTNDEIAVRVDFNTVNISETLADRIIIKVVYSLAGQGPFILR